MSDGDDSTRLPPELPKAGVGTQLSGIYQLDQRLGAGGMGEVWRGHNIQTGDHVAIKIVLPEFARDQTILSLFRKEASILNHLSHDAIVRYHVFTIDREIGRPYLAMEFVDGESLFDVMRRGPLPFEEAAKLCLRLASALAAVHGEDVFHRDLSPDNIVLPGGRVERAKIIDFGIARAAGIGEGTLLGGRFAGKYNYVSPEQLGLFGGDVGEKSDIYSLGLVMAAALLGKPLDMNGTQWEVVEKRRSVPDLAGVDERLRPLVESMLRPDPQDRAPSMQAVVDWLHDHALPRAGHGTRAGRPWAADGSDAPRPFVSHVPPAVLAQPPPPPPPPIFEAIPASSGMPKWALAAGAAAFVAVAGAGLFFGGFLRPEPAGVQEATAPQEETAPPGGAEAAGRETAEAPPEPQPAEKPAEAAEQKVDPAPAPADAGGQTADQAGRPAETEQVAIDVQPDPPAPPEPPAEAIDEVAQRISWLRTYPGGDCFFATATAATDKAIAIEGFGTEVGPFAALLAAFQAKFGIEPDISVRQIKPTQCAVTDFLRAAGAASAESPVLSLESTRVRDNSPVSGTLVVPPAHEAHLILIDHDGMAFNLDGRLTRSGGAASFSVPIGLSAEDRAAGQPLPEVILAVTAKGGIRAAAFDRPVTAAELLPRILAELRARDLRGAATAKYFQLGG